MTHSYVLHALKFKPHSDILFSSKQGLESSMLKAVVRGHLCDKWAHASEHSPVRPHKICTHCRLRVSSTLIDRFSLHVLGTIQYSKECSCMYLWIACWLFWEKCLSWERDYTFKWMASIYEFEMDWTRIGLMKVPRANACQSTVGWHHLSWTALATYQPIQ